jgi:hypothetical protein
MKQFLYILFLFVSLQLNARNETAIWYFGDNAGLDFRTGSPKAIFDGQLSSNEGCASICDRYGNLLFYTDGITVWDKNHNVMPNGTGLMGHNSSTQSAVIVPLPQQSGLYYIFTVDDKTRDGGFRYTLVDMDLNDGSGAVVDSIKNLLLFAPSAEKIAAISNNDCSGIWVISHEWNSNAFRAYLVGPNGIDTNAVISNTGIIYQGSIHNKKGYLKAHSYGSRLAAASGYTATFEVFDFDNTTGIISNPIKLDYDEGEAYGVEFSPDGTKLYVTMNDYDWWIFDNNDNELWQFDLEAGSKAEIAASRKIIASQSYNDKFGALQLGSDGKIYVARVRESSIAIINDPDAAGSLCNYSSTGISLGGRTVYWGLPFFIQSFFDNRSFIKIPEKNVKVATRNFTVPIYANLSCGNTDTFLVSFRAKIRFDFSIFYLKDILKATIQSLEHQPNYNMLVELSADSILLTSEPQIIAELQGDILLGRNSDTTILHIQEFEWSGKDIKIEIKDGLIKTYGVCQHDLRTLVEYKEELISLSPNPNNGILQAKIRMYHKGFHSLQITNLNGMSVWKKDWYYHQNDMNINNINIDLSSLNNGIYFVNYKTPGKVYFSKFILLK